MTSTSKALELLEFFTLEHPEIGLSELKRMARRDKATTFRQLSALQSAGLVEQNPTTRAYRIGPAVLRLAFLRERTIPRRRAATEALVHLAEATGQTAHASLLSGDTLRTIAVQESSRHSARVVINEAVLPLHATASGLVVLAFGDAALMDVAMGELYPFTETTLTDGAALSRAVSQTRFDGIGTSRQTFEDGVHGMAAPLFDESGHVAGAIAVATLAPRMTTGLATTIRAELIAAARQISTEWGGQTPPALAAAWANADPAAGW